MKNQIFLGLLLMFAFGCGFNSEPSQEERDKIEAELREKIELENEQKEAQRKAEIEKNRKIELQRKYNETIDFIKSKTSVYREGYWGKNGNTKYRTDYSFEIGDCSLNYKIETRDKTGVYHYYFHRVSIKELNPNHIEISDNGYGQYITLNVRGGRDLVKYKSDKTTRNDSEINSIDCLDNDRAKRVAKAFKFLIEYCGGKDEMY